MVDARLLQHYVVSFTNASGVSRRPDNDSNYCEYNKKVHDNLQDLMRAQEISDAPLATCPSLTKLSNLSL